ncbi:MAG: endolytic transglycosylase MltG [Patescibacteria group bacterium]
MEQNQTQSIVDEKKFHKLDPKKKPLYTAVGAFFIAIVLPVAFYLYYNTALNRPAQSDAEKVFVIEKGEGALSISQRLYDEGLINSKVLFNFYLISNNLQSKLQAGTYTVPAGYNIKKLSELFQQGRSDIKVTFLEGWRVEEVAQEASSKFGNVSYSKFVDLALPSEGTLFPDTYEFNSNTDEEGIIDAMRSNYNAKTSDILTNESVSKTGLPTVNQVITIASIVEREVIKDEDRRIVAGILIKRFKEDMPLGADATVQYAVAPKIENGNRVWWPKNLTIDDLNKASTYNTRKMAGLPPMPICSPSLSSIKAVIGYQSTDYYYYLTDSQGITHYAKTLDEHNKNIFKYLTK